MNEETWDVVVIGAGAVGENVADYAVKGGLTAVLVESELVGGECSYWACMPSKALLRSGKALRAARKVGGAREAVRGDLDVAAVLARRDSIAGHWHDDGQVEWVRKAGIGLIRGHGRLTGPKTVSVTAPDGGVTHLEANHAVVVSSGTDAYVPDVPGLRELGPWTSRDATSAHEVPATLTVVGGGPVGAEMATVFASFGTQVTLVARGGILDGREPFAGEMVRESLEALGATVRTGVSPVSASRIGDSVTLELDDGSMVTSQEILVAAGRAPRTTDIGLETIGLTPGDWLATDDTLRVDGVDWLYATGDANHRALLTHQGKYQARAAGEVIAARATGRPVADGEWGRHSATADHEAVPEVTFTDPEVASVGLTAAQAEATGYDVRVVDYDLGDVAGSRVLADGYQGRARMVVDAERRVVLGVTFVGQDVAELLHAATIAVVGQVPIDRLWHAVPAYPTMNEIWLRLLTAHDQLEVRSESDEAGDSGDRDGGSLLAALRSTYQAGGSSAPPLEATTR